MPATFQHQFSYREKSAQFIKYNIKINLFFKGKNIRHALSLQVVQISIRNFSVSTSFNMVAVGVAILPDWFSMRINSNGEGRGFFIGYKSTLSIFLP